MQPQSHPEPTGASQADPLIQPLDAETFDAQLQNASVPVLVEFTAPWCAPCRALEPILLELAREGRGRWLIVKVDGDDSPELATRLGVRGFPTLVLFAGGKEVGRQLGLTSKQKIMHLLASHAPAR